MRLLPILLLLAGCAHERVVIQTVEVRVPIPVPCAVALPADPERLTRKDPPAEDIYQAMQRSLAEIEGWEGWSIKAKAAASGCQQKPQGVSP